MTVCMLNVTVLKLAIISQHRWLLFRLVCSMSTVHVSNAIKVKVSIDAPLKSVDKKKRRLWNYKFNIIKETKQERLFQF